MPQVSQGDYNMPLGGSQNYLAKYNTYQLPGYVQNETFMSDQEIADHYAPYADGSPYSEYMGLKNKTLVVRLKVWEQDFATCKDQIELAATYLRSKRQGFADFYLQYTDKHYEALTQSINVENTAGRSVRLMEYEVNFECRPWLINDATSTITGTGLIDTDQVSRTITDGGWTPTTITVTGTNVTISGYTATGDFTGFLSIDGAVSGMVIDSEFYTAEIASVNRNDLMLAADYAIFAGPGKTYFNITGASSCSISYKNRWYI